MKHTHVSPWVARGLYLFAFALLFTAVVDLSTTVWPMRPGDGSWRYGFLGLMAGYLQTPTLGLVLVVSVALWQRDKGVLRIAGIVSVLAAVALLAAMGVFALDTMQMRAIRAAEAQAAVAAGGLFQALKYLIASVVLACLGLGALQTEKDIPRP